jgi:hypothetical protein
MPAPRRPLRRFLHRIAGGAPPERIHTVTAEVVEPQRSRTTDGEALTALLAGVQRCDQASLRTGPTVLLHAARGAPAWSSWKNSSILLARDHVEIRVPSLRCANV